MRGEERRKGVGHSEKLFIGRTNRTMGMKEREA